MPLTLNRLFYAMFRKRNKHQNWILITDLIHNRAQSFTDYLLTAVCIHVVEHLPGVQDMKKINLLTTKNRAF